MLGKDLPDYRYGTLVVESQVRGLDDGIFQSLNLLWTTQKMNTPTGISSWNPHNARRLPAPRVW